MFGLFIIIALGAGLAFNVITVVAAEGDRRARGAGDFAGAVGSIATAVFVVGGWRSSRSGGWSSASRRTVLFVVVTLMLFVGAAWSVVAQGPMLLVALAVAMAGVYGQVTVNDIVLARYTADAWRGRVYAVRYFLMFTTAGAAVATIAFLHARGGFDLVLLVDRRHLPGVFPGDARAGFHGLGRRSAQRRRGRGAGGIGLRLQRRNDRRRHAACARAQALDLGLRALQILEQPRARNLHEVIAEFRILEEQLAHLVIGDDEDLSAIDADRRLRALAVRRQHAEFAHHFARRDRDAQSPGCSGCRTSRR